MAEPSATDGRPGANVPEFSVSELSSAIRRALEDGFGFVRLRGEVSGFRGAHSSGHCYFALKDDRAKIEAVVWRNTYQRLKMKPQEGMEVVAQGRITTFPGSSKYQIVIDTLEPAGLGALMALLEERKKRLAGEGLFDEARKKALPFLPRVVGIVTSPTGAVIRDMLAGFTERFPTTVVVWPVRVQGDTSATEVAAAIRGFNALVPGGPLPRPDVLIVARGGGSLEDLWGFNEEIVVRAAAESRIPLISAVGHETDWTLLDLVADARAPTPTKAAEWTVPKYTDLAEQLTRDGTRLVGAARRLIVQARTHLKAASRGLPRREDLLAMPRQRLDACSGRLPRALGAYVGKHRGRLFQVAGRLPRAHALVWLPRQRFDACEKRLGRALLANTRAHWTRYERIGPRLQLRLLESRLARAGDRLEAAERRGRDALSRLAGSRRARFERLAGRLHPGEVRQRLVRSRERLDGLQARAERCIHHRIAENRRRVEGYAQLLGSLSYQSVLKRGYAVVRDAAGRPVRQAAKVQARDRLDIELADGRVRAEAVEGGTAATPAPDEAAPAVVPRPPPKRSGGSGQGSLF